ncbi:MAG: thioredoxin-like domain-containing protein [Candidatus Limimorpha sp.]
MKKLIIALAVLAGLVSCSERNTFKININLEYTKDYYVYLCKYVNGQSVVLDSVVLKNNAASFKIKKNENVDAYQIAMRIWRKNITVFPENQDVTISGDCTDFRNIKVRASILQSDLNDLNEKMLSDESDEHKTELVIAAAKENINNVLAPYIVYTYKWAFPDTDLLKIFEAIPEDSQSSYMPMLKSYVDNIQRVQPGKPYINFVQKNIDGSNFQLSNLIGKSDLLMVDFWASWCPDCRKENPAVVNAYSKFNKKGFEIVSVSLDNDSKAWLNGIQEDGLVWKNHVSDLKGWANAAAKEYCVAFIPQNYLIDKNGIIVAKNLYGDDLADFISSYLN